MVIGKSIQYKGGILLTSLLLIQLVSLMLITVLESSRATTDFYHKTIQYYEAAIMSELFWAGYQVETYPETGSKQYNTGIVTYEIQGEEVIVQCLVELRTFTFYYTLPLEGKLIDTDNDME